jgi:hypothetical protein
MMSLEMSLGALFTTASLAAIRIFFKVSIISSKFSSVTCWSDEHVASLRP